MVSHINDNKCICGHNRIDHAMKEGKALWCNSNGISCDCWQYVPRDDFKRLNDGWLGFTSFK